MDSADEKYFVQFQLLENYNKPIGRNRELLDLFQKVYA